MFYTISYHIKFFPLNASICILGIFPNNCIYILSAKLFLGYRNTLVLRDKLYNIKIYKIENKICLLISTEWVSINLVCIGLLKKIYFEEICFFLFPFVYIHV